MAVGDDVRKELSDVEAKLLSIEAKAAEKKLKAAQAEKRLALAKARMQVRIDAKQAFIYRQADTQQDIYLGRIMRQMAVRPVNVKLRSSILEELKGFVAEDPKREGALVPLIKDLEAIAAPPTT